MRDSKALTELSFASKRYWHYPEKYYEIWQNELTISPYYIRKNDVFIYEHDHAVVGYCSVISLENDMQVAGGIIAKGVWLEHLFVDPLHIGKGIGTKLFAKVRERCGMAGIREIGILADPNSRGFYEKMGCIYIREYPSTIKGRTTPYLQYHITEHPASAAE